MADWIKPWKYCMHIKWMPLVELVECVCVLCVFFFAFVCSLLGCRAVSQDCCKFCSILLVLWTLTYATHVTVEVRVCVCECLCHGWWEERKREKEQRTENIYISLAQIHQTEISFERECRCGRARSQFASGHQINQDSLACVCMQLLYLFCCCCCLLLSNYFICLVYTKHKVRNACEFRLVDDREWARIFCAGLIGCYFMSFYHHY